MNNSFKVHGAGLGLKRDFLDALKDQSPDPIGFLEIAPENWMGFGGQFAKNLRYFTERYDFTTHGLSLSIGGPTPLDVEFVKKLKIFLDSHNIKVYTEHLSYCSDDGHMYDLMPIPFTSEAVHYVADRIKQVQDILERKIGMENVSYYAAPGQELSEITFFNAVVEEADCDILLDVNNIYVNSINHQYDAIDFLKAMPGERVSYMHVAGHYEEAVDLIVDTHGADVIDPVWDLLHKAYETFGVMPTLLERDFNIPDMSGLMREVNKISEIQQQWSAKHHVRDLKVSS